MRKSVSIVPRASWQKRIKGFPHPAAEPIHPMNRRPRMPAWGNAGSTVISLTNSLIRVPFLLEAIDDLGVRGTECSHLVQLLALSGMRPGEATRIIWREVNFAKDQFTVSGGEVGTKNHEIRTVPLFPSLKRFLTELKKENAPLPTDGFISIASTRSALDSACRSAGFPHFTHHCLRH
jgi:integrase